MAPGITICFAALSLAALALAARAAGFSTPQDLSLSGSVACFGDYNSDKRTDLFVLSEDRRVLSVYLWSGSRYKRLQGASINETYPIEQVVASDFSFDGWMDVLVSGRMPDGTYFLHVWITEAQWRFRSTPLVLQDSGDQVLAMNYNNDMRVDLYGEWDGHRAFWQNDGDWKSFNFSMHLHSDPEAQRPLARNRSSGFVDLDGDCRADLFVTAEDPTTGALVFEIWLNGGPGTSESSPFRFYRRYFPPAGAGQPSFADVNRDGTIDVLFPVCYPPDTCAESSIHILFNKQKGMCSSRYDSGGASCRAQDDLCTADPNFRFDNDWNSTKGSPLHVIVPVSPSFALSPRIPLGVRVGDANMDGFPDLLLTLRGGSDSAGSVQVSYWENSRCSSSACPGGAAGQRTFVSRSDSSLESVPGAYTAAFIDLNDNGNLDVMMMTTDASGSEKTFVLRNQFHEDAYFLTSLGLNGVCQLWCGSSWRSTFPRPKPYGVNAPGIVTKFTLTDLGGTKRPRVGTQLTQSAYLPLQTPYQFFGLGRTNNYIEDYFMGVPLRQSKNWNYWVAIIPNSQLIMFPYPPTHPSEWELELFISPSASLVIVSVAWAVCLMVLAIGIGYLHWKEKRADELDKQVEQIIIAF